MSTATDRRDGAIRTRNRPTVPGAPFIPELDKAAPGGVATLDGSTSLIPTSQLGTGAANATTALFGDSTFKAAALAADLTTETNNRVAADAAEAATRAAADTTLQTNINNEATSRAAGDALALQKANNLSDVANAGTSRTNLGLGNSATKNVGAIAGTVCAGDDARLSDSRAPNGAAGGDLSGTYPNPAVAALAITDAKVAAANKDGVAGIASMRTLGAGAQQACAGNDSRLSDKRLPLCTPASLAGVVSGVATTALALGAISVNGERWEVSIGGSTFAGGIMVIVVAVGAAWTILLSGATGGVTASISGNNLQVTQATGSNQSFDVRGTHYV